MHDDWKIICTESYPVVDLTQCFKIYYMYLHVQCIGTLHLCLHRPMQFYIVYYFESPTSLITGKPTYMKYTFICWFHVIDFKLQFCNYFIFFPFFVISLLLSLFQFLFCGSYIYKLYMNESAFFRNDKHECIAYMYLFFHWMMMFKHGK